MLTGKIRNDIDKLWEKFWTGGITNPLTVIEQISYLMFARMLDMQEDVAERKANRTGKPFDRLFPNTPEGQLLRWKNFRNMSGRELHKHLKQNVYPYFAKLGRKSDAVDGLGEEGSALEALGHISEYMQDADLEIKNESVLTSAVEMVNELPLTQSDVKGDIYEYLLSKLTTAGINGQFRTPRHIIELMVRMMDPKGSDIICDPACGTAGFLVSSAEYLLKEKPEIFADSTVERHFHDGMFHGFDFDSTMLRIGSMNMMLHGVENPRIENRDSLSETHSHIAEKYSLILANPPFAGSLDNESCAKNIQAVVKTKKTELLFLALFLRLLKTGGRAAVIVPDGVLFGSSTAHKTLRQKIVEEQKLEAIISMPSGVFKPYAGVSTAIMIFTKTMSGGTDKVWFYDMQADGYSLDDKRNELDSAKHENNNIPDIIARFHNLASEVGRKATEQSFLVDKADIAANGYDLSINRYKEVVYEQVEHEAPSKILADLEVLEQDILKGMAALKELLK